MAFDNIRELTYILNTNLSRSVVFVSKKLSTGVTFIHETISAPSDSGKVVESREREVWKCLVASAKKRRSNT